MFWLFVAACITSHNNTMFLAIKNIMPPQGARWKGSADRLAFHTDGKNDRISYRILMKRWLSGISFQAFYSSLTKKNYFYTKI